MKTSKAETKKFCLGPARTHTHITREGIGYSFIHARKNGKMARWNFTNDTTTKKVQYYYRVLHTNQTNNMLPSIHKSNAHFPECNKTTFSFMFCIDFYSKDVIVLALIT